MLHDLLVPAAAAGARLDVYLESVLAGCSRSLVARCIKQGRCSIQPGKLKSGYRLRGGERIAIEVPELQQVSFAAEAMPLVVIYEDQDCLIIDKPPGLVVHPAVGHPTGTLLNGLLAYAAGAWSPALAHRLDADTSGLIAVAKHLAAHEFLQDAFRQRQVEKTYLALAAGSPKADLLSCEAPLGRHPGDFRKRAVLAATLPAAKAASTRFLVRRRLPHYCVLEARPHTGRTHQIRVHAAHLGHPLLADQIYGRAATWPLRPLPDQPLLQRQALHAWRLRLPLPAGGERVFDSPIPADLQLWVGEALQPLR